MRYLPATALALAVGGAVVYGLYITHGSLFSLLGLFGLMVVPNAVPEDPEVAKARYAAEAAKDKAFWDPDNPRAGSDHSRTSA